jgi:hypothetical protein
VIAKTDRPVIPILRPNGSPHGPLSWEPHLSLLAPTSQPASNRAITHPVSVLRSRAFEVSTLTRVDQLGSIQAEWLDLLRRAKLDLPFIWPEWVITWWELFRQQRPVIRDNLRIKTVRRHSGELVAIIPMMMTERPAVGPARVRSIGFLGARRLRGISALPGRVWSSQYSAKKKPRPWHGTVGAGRGRGAFILPGVSYRPWCAGSIYTFILQHMARVCWKRAAIRAGAVGAAPSALRWALCGFHNRGAPVANSLRM